MPSLSSTIRNLNTLRRHLSERPDRAGAEASTRLEPMRDFGSNPGALRGWSFVPDRRPANAALVVVLHGCTQSAAAYDRGSGWSDLAREHGFAVLYPEQTRANNVNLCFNWFEPKDTRRGDGEALSIVQMIQSLADRHDLDRGRVFITGLSAGGAMTSVLLATYPELFAGGAIIAGLPYGTASGVSQALERMRGAGMPSARALPEFVRRASGHSGSWPTIAVWHGSADTVVDSANAGAILQQWQSLHRVGQTPDVTDIVDGHPHRAWRGPDGKVVLEDYRITGMGHGTPLSALGKDACGQPGPHMLEAAISSTRHAASAWGLLTPTLRDRTARTLEPTSRQAPAPMAPTYQPAAGGVTETIEAALRTAGLLK